MENNEDTAKEATQHSEIAGEVNKELTRLQPSERATTGTPQKEPKQSSAKNPPQPETAKNATKEATAQQETSRENPTTSKARVQRTENP